MPLKVFNKPIVLLIYPIIVSNSLFIVDKLFLTVDKRSPKEPSDTRLASLIALFNKLIQFPSSLYESSKILNKTISVELTHNRVMSEHANMDHENEISKEETGGTL